MKKEWFKDSPTGRKANQSTARPILSSDPLGAISDLPKATQPPNTSRYAYRSLDRQWIFSDARLIDRPNRELWNAHGPRQMYLASLLYDVLGRGPALAACAEIPDLHYFSGRGAKDIVPFWRNADASEANILPGLLQLLRKSYGFEITPAEFIAYVYGVLAQPAFTALYSEQLETRELRVPITKDASLFENAREIGARLLWLHTYATRFVPEGRQRDDIPRGAARCTKQVPGDRDNYPEFFEYNEATKTLSVGSGKFSPVERDIFEFEVSGLKVVQSWLKYRMKNRAGKKSSPLDDIRPEYWTSQFTTELLELLWVLEGTVATYPRQTELLRAIVAGECFRNVDFPEAPASMRKPPKMDSEEPDLFGEPK